MHTNRLTRAVVIAFAVAAVAAPTATARPVDGPAGWTLPHGFQSDAATPRPQQPSKDLRHPDSRDYAEGRGTYNAPEVVVVAAPEPAPQPSAGGIDWADVGLGAGGLLALGLIALGGGLLIVHRHGARQLAG